MKRTYGTADSSFLKFIFFAHSTGRDDGKIAIEQFPDDQLIIKNDCKSDTLSADINYLLAPDD